MASQWFVSMAFIICALVGAEPQTASAQVPGKLDGTWYVAWQEKFGNTVPSIVAKRQSLIIDGSKMEWHIGNPAPNMAAAFALDPSKNTIDAKVTRGSLNGRTMLGIYKIEEGLLHICWAEIDAKRPQTFASTKPGGGVFEYVIYSRSKDLDLKKQTAKQVGGSGKKDIEKLQIKVADGWKDEGYFFGIRRFRKEKTELLAVLHTGKLPATPLDLVEMTKMNKNLFPGYVWSKTTGIGKLADGVFIVGECKAAVSAVGLGVARNVDGATVLFIGAPAGDAATRKEMLDMVRSARFDPADVVTKTPTGKRPKLADMKFSLPKKWEAKYNDIVTWRIAYDDFSPSIEAMWMARDYPRTTEGLIKKFQETDYFGNGMYLTKVLDQGKLSDGLYVVGKFKVGKDGKESKYTGFAVFREFDGYSLIFQSFSTSYDDKLLKQALDVCKSAKF